MAGGGSQPTATATADSVGERADSHTSSLTLSDSANLANYTVCFPNVKPIFSNQEKSHSAKCVIAGVSCWVQLANVFEDFFSL